jgi:acetyl-CoA C-acetyltransferase
MAVVIAQTPDGRRVAGHTDADTAAALHQYTGEGARSLIGASVDITDSGGLLTVDTREGEPR